MCIVIKCYTYVIGFIILLSNLVRPLNMALFVKNREGIVVVVIGVLMSILVIGSMILKFDEVMRVDCVVDDHIEDVELTDEMVETYQVLVLSGMED